MSDISSSPAESDDAENSQKRATLVSDEQRIKRENQKTKLKIESYENDIQIARQACAFGQSLLLNRMKRLAAMFGDKVQSNEEILSNIQTLRKSAQEDEAKIGEYKKKIAIAQSAAEESQKKFQSLNSQLEKERALLGQRSRQAEQLRLKKAELLQTLQSFRKSSEIINNELSPLANALNTTIDDPQLFTKLHDQIGYFTADLNSELEDLLDSCSVRPSEQVNWEKDFGQITEECFQLQSMLRSKSRAEESMQKKIDELAREIAEKKKEKENVCRENREIEQRSSRLREEEKQRERKRKEAESATIRSAELDGLKFAARAFGIVTHGNADEMAMLLKREVIRKAKMIREAKESSERVREAEAQRRRMEIQVIIDSAKAIEASNDRLIRRLR